MIHLREQRRQAAHTARSLWRALGNEIRDAWDTRPIVLADLPDLGLTWKHLRRRAGELRWRHRPRRTRTLPSIIRDLQARNRDLQRQNADLTNLLAKRDKQIACLAAVNKALHECNDRAIRIGYAVVGENAHAQGETEGLSFDAALRQLDPEGYGS